MVRTVGDQAMPQHLSREEFRRWAEGQPRRYERIAGEPVAMSPEGVGHARIKSRVWAALDRAIRSANLPCEALPDGITIEIDDETDYEPDAVVNCGPPVSADAIAAPNPVIVVEVLSPSTQAIDGADKLADYFRVASVQHYLIFRSRRREVIHHRRMGDEIATRVINLGAIALDPPGITIDLADIYTAPL
jgi:Uma2 family endonuclease